MCRSAQKSCVPVPIPTTWGLARNFNPIFRSPQKSGPWDGGRSGSQLPNKILARNYMKCPDMDKKSIWQPPSPWGGLQKWGIFSKTMFFPRNLMKCADLYRKVTFENPTPWEWSGICDSISKNGQDGGLVQFLAKEFVLKVDLYPMSGSGTHAFSVRTCTFHSISSKQL